MPRDAKQYIPIDLFGRSGQKQVMFILDQDAEPQCAIMQITTKTMDLEIRMNETVLKFIHETGLETRILLATDSARTKGAARAMRKKTR